MLTMIKTALLIATPVAVISTIYLAAVLEQQWLNRKEF